MAFKYVSKYHKNNESQGLSDITKTRLVFAGVLILAIFFFGVAWPKFPDGWPASGFFNQFYPHLGLDLQGGTHLVYQADTSQLGESEKSAAVEGVRDVIERRVNAYGVAEPVVQTTRSGSDYRVIVELAGVTDVNQAIKLIGETPLLEFKELDKTQPAQPTAEKTTSELGKFNDDQRKKAEDILKQALAGVNFEQLAKDNSEDPGSTANGGDLGFAKKGAFVPEFDAVLFDKLKDGEIYPEIVETAFGYHVIKRVESRTAEDGSLEVRGEHILKKIATADNNNNLNWIPTQLTGKQLKRATVTFTGQTNMPVVSLTFNTEGAQLFDEITGRNIGNQVGIFLDNELISAPTVQAQISGGQAEITGNFSLEEAKMLAQRLNAGALPVSIQLISQQTVGATLGKISLEKSLYAGLIGLILVAVFMILYYRLPGLIAVCALIIYTVLALGLFELIPVTLTLAGIAGFILSIGMAVDANVLIFERLKEELRDGESLATAINHGFSRAWLSIRDSNVSSLITTFILFWFGSSIIKGFALTLGLGILISMFSAIFVSRIFLKLIIQNKTIANAHWLFGVRKVKEAQNND